MVSRVVWIFFIGFEFFTCFYQARRKGRLYLEAEGTLAKFCQAKSLQTMFCVTLFLLNVH